MPILSYYNPLVDDLIENHRKVFTLSLLLAKLLENRKLTKRLSNWRFYSTLDFFCGKRRGKIIEKVAFNLKNTKTLISSSYFLRQSI